MSKLALVMNEDGTTMTATIAAQRDIAATAEEKPERNISFITHGIVIENNPTNTKTARCNTEA